MPIFFFVRRAAFIFSVFHLGNYLWAQLTIQSALSAIIFGHYWAYKPLDSLYALRMESFNEVTVIALSDLLICFTDFVP